MNWLVIPMLAMLLSCSGCVSNTRIVNATPERVADLLPVIAEAGDVRPFLVNSIKGTFEGTHPGSFNGYRMRGTFRPVHNGAKTEVWVEVERSPLADAPGNTARLPTSDSLENEFLDVLEMAVDKVPLDQLPVIKDGKMTWKK